MRNHTLLCDFYELTMANGYFELGKGDEIAYFDVFFRTLPDGGGFAIAAGLSQVIDYIKNLKFTEEDIAYLRGKGVFSERFLAYLKGFRFTGDIYAVPEGTPIFPGEPFMTVRDPSIEAQFIETYLLLALNHQSLIATKANRVVRAAQGRAVAEFGSRRAQGADGDFLENVLRRIAYAFRFDDNEYYKALASSFLLSVDNGHAVHPNHPEKSDPTNRPILGGGVLLKSHANRAYITDAMSLAVVKSLLDNANVPYQEFFNRSDAASGSTLGSLALRHVSVKGADIGVAQLAMHSACECMATEDFNKLCEGLKAYYSSTLRFLENSCVME